MPRKHGLHSTHMDTHTQSFTQHGDRDALAVQLRCHEHITLPHHESCRTLSRHRTRRDARTHQHPQPCVYKYRVHADVLSLWYRVASETPLSRWYLWCTEPPVRPVVPCRRLPLRSLRNGPLLLYRSHRAGVRCPFATWYGRTVGHATCIRADVGTRHPRCSWGSVLHVTVVDARCATVTVSISWRSRLLPTKYVRVYSVTWSYRDGARLTAKIVLCRGSCLRSLWYC